MKNVVLFLLLTSCSTVRVPTVIIPNVPAQRVQETTSIEDNTPITEDDLQRLGYLYNLQCIPKGYERVDKVLYMCRCLKNIVMSNIRGKIKFFEDLHGRLEYIKPTKEQTDACLKEAQDW